jgi:hypothetical protein
MRVVSKEAIDSLKENKGFQIQTEEVQAKEP